MKKIKSCEETIHQYIPEEINLDSPKQLGEFLFEELKLPYKGRKTATGQYKTDSKALHKVYDEHVIVPLLIERRGAVKLKSTYVDGLQKEIQSDGRIHTTYLQNFVNTGRLSSRQPNLQNIPIRTEEGRQFRKLFVPQEGWTLIAADYSQIELRVMAHLAQVKNLIQAFKDDRDIHTETAIKMFNVEAVSSEQRRQAKIINFSMIYGASPYGLADNLKVDVETAKIFMKVYFDLYPEIQDYMKAKEEEGQKYGFVETLFGRKCFIPLENERDAKFSARVSVNAPVQGTAADMMRLAMIRVDDFFRKENLKTKMLLQIHDEIILETPPEEKDFVVQSLRKIMESVYALNIPLKVDIGVGKNWDEAH
ncbi:MAG: hypothetical protein JXR30_04205 [Alphaproteobacteria bacterium]|nr:hypothetical protein [Alphaproteobacteria bacterium]